MYRPLKRDTGLYRIFADVDADNRDAIRGFADKYGMLGTIKAALLKRPVEPWEEWKKQIADMRRLSSFKKWSTLEIPKRSLSAFHGRATRAITSP